MLKELPMRLVDLLRECNALEVCKEIARLYGANAKSGIEYMYVINDLLRTEVVESGSAFIVTKERDILAEAAGYRIDAFAQAVCNFLRCILPHRLFYVTQHFLKIGEVLYDDVQLVDVCGEKFATDFLDWKECLGMHVMHFGYSNTRALAHILWDMTFYGYSNDEVQAKKEELFNDDDIDKLLEEARRLV